MTSAVSTNVNHSTNYGENSLVKPFAYLYGRLTTTFDELPKEGALMEVIGRILTVLTTPLWFFVCGFFAVIGACYESLFGKATKSEKTPNVNLSFKNDIEGFKKILLELKSDIDKNLKKIGSFKDINGFIRIHTSPLFTLGYEQDNPYTPLNNFLIKVNDTTTKEQRIENINKFIDSHILRCDELIKNTKTTEKTKITLSISLDFFITETDKKNHDLLCDFVYSERSKKPYELRLESYKKTWTFGFKDKHVRV